MPLCGEFLLPTHAQRFEFGRLFIALDFGFACTHRIFPESQIWFFEGGSKPYLYTGVIGTNISAMQPSDLPLIDATGIINSTIMFNVIRRTYISCDDKDGEC